MVANPFGKLFGRSPIRPIQEHMQLCDQAAQALLEFVDASQRQEWDQAKEAHKQIVSLEREADKVKKSVRMHLPKNLFLPVPRADLLELVTRQDGIANTAQDIASMMITRRMHFPPALEGKLREFLDSCRDASAQALEAVQELDELLEVGFSGREVEIVENMIRELDRIEQQTDKQANGLRRAVYRQEAELPPVDVMFFYQVIDLVAELADCAERVGHRLQILIPR